MPPMHRDRTRGKILPGIWYLRRSRNYSRDRARRCQQQTNGKADVGHGHDLHRHTDARADHRLIRDDAFRLALDPVPKIAGTAASLVTALQNLAGSLGSFAAAIIYDGSITRIVIILGLSGAATAVLFFLFRHAILGDKPLHVSDDDG